MADVLNHGARAETDGKEDRKSLEIITAIYRSPKELREVVLPAQQKESLTPYKCWAFCSVSRFKSRSIIHFFQMT